MNDDVARNGLSVLELFRAQGTLEQVNLGMNVSLVLGQRIHPVETFAANVTNQSLFACWPERKRR